MTSSTTAPVRERARRGFTLIEIIMAMTILAVIGGALVRLIVMQSRFTEGQMALRSARTVSRNAMNIMLTDLRMVQDKDGLTAADSSSVTVRVPVDFGLLCTSVGGPTISLLPADSAMTALGVYAGWAYRDSASGEYRYTDAATPLPIASVAAGVGATCGSAGISSVTVNGRSSKVISLVDAATIAPNAGWPAFIYQIITYKFDASTTFPGRLGLYRIVKTSSPSAPIKDEIIAPFDRSARFRFYVLNSDEAQDAVPASLNSVRGLELVLAGSSVRVPEGSKQTKQATMVTGVFFKNRRDP